MDAGLSDADKAFLDKCEEELKDRYTEKDDDFMSVFNSEPSKPPVIESWWVPNNSGRHNDRRYNRRHNPYERYGNNRNRERGYNDYNRSYDNRDQGYRPQRNKYHY